MTEKTKFDQLREAAITRIVRVKQLEHDLALAAAIEQPATYENPLGVPAEDMRQAVDTIKQNMHINFRWAAEGYVDARLINLLTEGAYGSKDADGKKESS